MTRPTNLVLAAFLAAPLALLGTLRPAAQEQPPAPKAQAEAGTPAGAHKVQLHRPFSQGQRYTMSLDMNVHYEGKMGDGLGESGDIGFLLSGKVLVMGVNSIGEPTMMMFHVDKAVETTQGKPKSLKVEGADLGVTFVKGQARFTPRDGREVPQDEQEWLSQIFQAPSGIKMDEWMGVGREVKAGESWEIDKAIFAKVLAGPEADPKAIPDASKIAGSVTLVGVEDLGGTPCYRIRSERTVQGGENPNFSGESFTQFKEDYLLPVDPASVKQEVQGEFMQRIKGKLISKDGGMLDVRSVQKVTYKQVIQ